MTWSREAIVPVICGLLAFACLLPTAAQAILSGFVGLRFLIFRQWQPLTQDWRVADLSDALRSHLQRMHVSWLVLFASQVLLLVLQVSSQIWQKGDWLGTLQEYARLMGKQGFYGLFLIYTLLQVGLVRRRSFSWVAFAKAWLGFCLITLLYMIGQRYLAWDWVHGFDAKLGEHRFAYGVYRASAWMGHPLTLAYCALLVGLYALAEGLFRWQQGQSYRVWLVLWLANAALIILSGSRFPLLIFLGLSALALMVRVAKFRTKWPWLLLGILSLGALVLFFDPNLRGRMLEALDSQVHVEERFDRLIFWQVHWKMFLEQPWFGANLSLYDARLIDYYDKLGYASMERKYTAHQIYLQTLADSGLIGGLVLLVLLSSWLRLAWEAARKFGHLGLLLLWAATVVSGLMQNNLRDSEYLFALWTLIGLCCLSLLLGSRNFESSSRSNIQDHQPRED